MSAAIIIRNCVIVLTSAWFAGACVQAAATRPDRAELRQARQRLALAEATANRISRERAVLNNSGHLGPEVVADLDAYQESVSAIVERQRQVVTRLESESPGGKGKRPDPAVAKLPDSYGEPATRHDKLEDEFAESLAAFDEFLLVEIEAAEQPATAGSDPQMTELARQAAAAAERLRERGIDVAGQGPASGTSGDGSGQPPEAPAGEGEPASADEVAGAAGESGAQVGNGQQPPPQQPASSKVPGDGNADAPTGGGAPPGTPPPDDDDIVARQLREAAERETDPELREKLWREYRAYKEGRSPQ